VPEGFDFRWGLPDLIAEALAKEDLSAVALWAKEEARLR